MALKEHLVLMILLIGASSSLAWNTNTRRGYDLERGPVFYEAYYPDSNEEQRSNYQEKRYFDHGAVLERSYQVPPVALDYQASSVPRAKDYQNVPEKLSQAPNYREERGMPENSMRTDRMTDFHSGEQYQPRDGFLPRAIDTARPDNRYNPFSGLSGNSLGTGQSLGIKEISSIARRAISRDLENWSMIENYLDRAANYQNQGDTSYRSREIAETAPTAFDSLPGTLQGTKDERIAGESAQSIMMQRDSPLLGTLGNRAAPARNSFDAYEANRYENQRLSDWQPQGRSESLVKVAPAIDNQPINHASQDQSTVNNYPPENIFEPRPQIIKYVLSKTAKTTDAKVQGTKETPKQSVPRNYGDNLIRDEIKKSDDPGNIKITSIEVSEVPRHKTRHHHGEWPRRDYSHRHSNR